MQYKHMQYTPYKHMQYMQYKHIQYKLYEHTIRTSTCSTCSTSSAPSHREQEVHLHGEAAAGQQQCQACSQGPQAGGTQHLTLRRGERQGHSRAACTHTDQGGARGAQGPGSRSKGGSGSRRKEGQGGMEVQQQQLHRVHGGTAAAVA